MTKETKIGLLVGLAFIILFAIILSEKGANRGVEPPVLKIADSTDDGSGGTGSVAPLRNDGKLPVEDLPPLVESDLGQTAPITDHPPTEELVSNTGAGDGQELPSLPDWLVEKLNLPVEGTSVADDTSLDAAPIDVSPVFVDTGETGNRISEGGVASNRFVSGAGVSDRTGIRTARRTETAGRTSIQPAAIKAIHVVQPSECLGKIAARYYGRSTPARVKAIFEANRDVLKTIDSVRADDTLKIPSLDGASPVTIAGLKPTDRVQFEPATSVVGDGHVRIPYPVDESSTSNSRGARESELATNSSRTARSSLSSTQFRWYRVRSGDSLSAIARRELGAERRFAEIFELNRDRLNNKNMLKPGMKIRLPLDEDSPAASASATRYWDAFD